MANSSTDIVTGSGLSTPVIALRTSCIAVISLLIVTGNILSIAVTRSLPSLADSTKVLMTTLAVYDLFAGAAGLVAIIPSALDRWPFGDPGCLIMATWASMCAMMSITSIVFLNIERYIAITRPYEFPIWCSKRRVVGLVVCTSMIHFGIAVLNTVGMPLLYIPAAAVCTYTLDNDFFYIVALITMDICPTISLTFIYYRLIKISRQHELRNPRNKDNAAHRAQDNKALRSFLAVTLTYSICYTPMLVRNIAVGFSCTELPRWMVFVFVWLYISNSALNVVIFCLFNKAFRQRAKKILAGRFTCFNNSVGFLGNTAEADRSQAVSEQRVRTVAKS